MGNGTAFGIVGPPPPGVVAREHKSWPIIPKKLLTRTPQELQENIDRFDRALQGENSRFFPSMETIQGLEDNVVVYQFAKTAVERLLSQQDQS